jgi:hypothetical protein
MRERSAGARSLRKHVSDLPITLTRPGWMCSRKPASARPGFWIACGRPRCRSRRRPK